MKYKAIYWFILSPFIKSYLNIHFSKSQTKEFTKKAKSFYKDLLAKANDICDFWIIGNKAKKSKFKICIKKDTP